MLNAKLYIEELESTKRYLKVLKEKEKARIRSTQKSTGQTKRRNKRDQKAKVRANMGNNTAKEFIGKGKELHSRRPVKSRTTSAGKETENARKSSEEERAADLEDSNGDQSGIPTEPTSKDKLVSLNVNKLARLSKVIRIAQEVPVSRFIISKIAYHGQIYHNLNPFVQPPT